MASGVYKTAIAGFVTGLIDWDTDTIKAQLTSSSYTPDFDTHDFLDDVQAYKIAGTTDQTVATRTITYDTDTNKVYLDCAVSVTFSSVASGALKGVALYKSRGGAASADNLVCWCEFVSPGTADGSDVTVNFNTNGAISAAY